MKYAVTSTKILISLIVLVSTLLPSASISSVLDSPSKCEWERANEEFFGGTFEALNIDLLEATDDRALCEARLRFDARAVALSKALEPIEPTEGVLKECLLAAKRTIYLFGNTEFFLKYQVEIGFINSDFVPKLVSNNAILYASGAGDDRLLNEIKSGKARQRFEWIQRLFDLDEEERIGKVLESCRSKNTDTAGNTLEGRPDKETEATTANEENSSKLPGATQDACPNRSDFCVGKSPIGTDGDVYEGEWLNRVPHGKGKLILASGDQYEGEFVNGILEGVGKVTYTSGNFYEGEFRKGVFDGNGVFRFKNGEEYVGEFRGSMYHGRGLYTFPSGETYVGEYRNDKRDGKGTLTLTDGTKYTGDFENNQYNGRGVLQANNGDKYDGEFKDGVMEGVGVYLFSNGSKYEGQFLNGNFNGRGTFTFADGSRYVGEFKDNKYDGHGVLYGIDGTVRERGIYKADQLVEPD